MDYKKQFENDCTSYLDGQKLGEKPIEMGEFEWQAKKPGLLDSRIKEIKAILLAKAENVIKQASANGENNLADYLKSIITQKLNEFRERYK